MTDLPTVYAKGWRQDKRLGGALLMVCAECLATGRGYSGDGICFYKRFEQAIQCVLCGAELGT